MSVLSRAAAPAATHDAAAAIAALLTVLDTSAPADLFAAASSSAEPGDEAARAEQVMPAVTRLLGPRGLGAAALRLPDPPVAVALPEPAETASGAPEPVAAQAQSVSIGTTDNQTAHDNHTRSITTPTPAGSPETPVGSAQGAGPAGLPAARIPSGPTGLGSASAIIRGPGTPISVGSSQRMAPIQDGGGTAATPIPPLYCPPPLRDDPVLAAEVNEGLIGWAREIGLYEGRLDELRDADFGRLIMLAHPDCDDADRLLAAAKCAVSEWSVDDYYCEEGADERAPDGSPSSATAELGPRLELAAAAIDPVHLPEQYTPQLEAAMRADPILRAFRTSFDHLSRYATPAQLARLRTEIAGWFIALSAEAGWRVAGRMPPVWEYLTNRQPHSFLPCMAPIDAVGGYELNAAEYTDPRVRRVVTTAALASQMVNDLYSMAREDEADHVEFNLPTVLAAEENCSRREAVVRTAAIHDELVHRFEREAGPLAATGSAELRRFLIGLWSWMGGNRAWHADSKRYNDSD
ncbi:family 2 encapsulin nanocompartment cargo protein terpene cyclase [Nocardia sp. NPDC050710]|uniref:family 2 encapsulin nanocompartment cargo protein terpene cyclase n=1 Tax=Nocardia sp. NPDC050710 TaxID=3157220 RepID=UPI0033D8673F